MKPKQTEEEQLLREEELEHRREYDAATPAERDAVIKGPNYECEGCDAEGCQDCCSHDYDPDEGMMCLNCGAEYPW